MNTTPETLVVEQCDREAAASVHAAQHGTATPEYNWILDGVDLLNAADALAHPTPEPCSPVAREGERSRGFMDGLDHIAHFINALDSGDMTAKQVRTAIYSECLTARSAQTPPALSGGGELREAWPTDGTCRRCGCAPRNAEGLCATCADELPALHRRNLAHDAGGHPMNKQPRDELAVAMRSTESIVSVPYGKMGAKVTITMTEETSLYDTLHSAWERAEGNAKP